MKPQPNGISVNPETSTFGTSTSFTTMSGLYSEPVLMNVIVNSDTIELVYQRHYRVTSGYFIPPPEVYKEIYSRTDGSMVVEKGRYIPAQSATYEFD